MLISQLGAVATVAPVTAVQVNENDAVMHRLGTCVVPFGDLPQGQTAIRVGVEYSNGRQVTAEVMSGSIEIIPLKLNEQAFLTLYPAPTVDVGLGPGERARAAEEIDGGLVGLIIDARGRPLSFPANENEATGAPPAMDASHRGVSAGLRATACGRPDLIYICGK